MPSFGRQPKKDGQTVEASLTVFLFPAGKPVEMGVSSSLGLMRR